jgi:hypothetical protein
MVKRRTEHKKGKSTKRDIRKGLELAQVRRHTVSVNPIMITNSSNIDLV